MGLMQQVLKSRLFLRPRKIPGWAPLATAAPRTEKEKEHDEKMIREDVQKFGHEYLKRQEESGRPISPHLGIYKPQLTWLMSISHRVSGVVLSAGLLIGASAFAIGPWDFPSFILAVDEWKLPWLLLDASKFAIVFPIVFHTLNGIRFLGFDMAVGAKDIHTMYRTGWAVLVASTLLSLGVVWKSRHDKNILQMMPCPYLKD